MYLNYKAAPVAESVVRSVTMEDAYNVMLESCEVQNDAMRQVMLADTQRVFCVANEASIGENMKALWEKIKGAFWKVVNFVKNAIKSVIAKFKSWFGGNNGLSAGDIHILQEVSQGKRTIKAGTKINKFRNTNFVSSIAEFAKLVDEGSKEAEAAVGEYERAIKADGQESADKTGRFETWWENRKINAKKDELSKLASETLNSIEASKEDGLQAWNTVVALRKHLAPLENMVKLIGSISNKAKAIENEGNQRLSYKGGVASHIPGTAASGEKGSLKSAIASIQRVQKVIHSLSSLATELTRVLSKAINVNVAIAKTIAKAAGGMSADDQKAKDEQNKARDEAAKAKYRTTPEEKAQDDARKAKAAQDAAAAK